MNNRDKVTELLKNYRSYRYAVKMYDKNIGIPAASIATYDDMPRGGSFGSRTPLVNDGFQFADQLDYHDLVYVVRSIEGAVEEVLNSKERLVIEKKYIGPEAWTLYKISIDEDKDESTIRRWHKEALRKLSIALGPVEKPKMYKIPEKNLQNARLLNASA